MVDTFWHIHMMEYHAATGMNEEDLHVPIRRNKSKSHWVKRARSVRYPTSFLLIHIFQ